MTGDPDRPFYRLGERLLLGALPREDFARFLRDAFARSGTAVEEGVPGRILDQAEEVPYNVQRLAHEVWEAARSMEASHLAVGAVDDALRRIVIREDPAYTQIWSQLTTNRKKALKAVIVSGGQEMLSAGMTRELRIPASSLQVALQALLQAGLVRIEATRGETRHRLVDPFFAHWLEMSQSS